MSTRETVLYDTPGPRRRRTNLILAVATIIVTALILCWVGSTLAPNGQFEADKWTPFLKSTTWTAYLLPGLVGTLTAAALSIVLALAIGAALRLGLTRRQTTLTIPLPHAAAVLPALIAQMVMTLKDSALG